MTEEEKEENTIALKYITIKELKNIRTKVEKSEDEKIRLKIETKHWYGYSEPFLSKSKDRLKVSKHTMLKILDEAIKKEEDYINKLIDKEIMIRRNELCQRKEE